MNLPKSFVSVAAKYGISKEEIIFAAMADFDSEYRFADTIVALTAEKLVLAAYPYREKEEYRFGGYGGWQITEGRTAGKESLSRERAALVQEPALQIFELQKVGKTEVIRQVSTGVLLGEIDGVERNLCHFSNTRMESFLKVCSLAQKLKKGEEISEEDLNIQKGKECCPQCGMLYPDQERKICPKCMDKKSILFRVLSYFKPYKKCLVVMMLCYLGTAALNLVWPYLSGTILYDRILAFRRAAL